MYRYISTTPTRAGKETQERLKLLIESSTDGIWDWDLLTNELYLSPRFKEQLGYSDYELKNSFETWESRVHPDDKEKAISDYTANMDGKTDFYENIHRLRHKDGSWVWILDRGKTTFNENGKAVRMVGFHTDITQIKELELELKITNEALHKSEDKLRDLLNSLSVGVVVHAPDTSIVMNNPKASELLGLNDEQLRGMQAIDPEWKFLDLSKVIVPVEEYPVNKIIRTEKQIENMTLGIVQKNTTDVVWVLVNGFPIFNDQDEIIEIIINFVDITELKHKDEMLINQSRQAAMGEMIGMIAHQWRQPISVIAMDANNMLLDIAMDKFNETEAEEYANNITLQTQNLSHTIDDFRNFFKPDKVISKVNIRDIFNQTLSIVKDSLRNNNIELKISYQTEKEVSAYPRELMQVFVNIINNSKDALVSKNKEKSIIDIEVYEDKKYVNTKICDNGGGIDADILSKVFDPYFSTKDEKTGTGLGLYMSKMIIEKHLNGVIDVYNSDEGACFTIRLLKQS